MIRNLYRIICSK